MYRLYVIALTAIGAMFLLAAFFAPGLDDGSPAPVAAKGPAKASGETDALLLKRDGSGQFHLNATVNGSEVKFLVDTGADMVALTVEEAEALGVAVNEGEFEPMMQTASGVGYGAAVTLDEVEVAGAVLHDVDAVVVKGLTTNLLGQSVLRKMGGVELKGDTMVIRSR